MLPHVSSWYIMVFFNLFRWNFFICFFLNKWFEVFMPNGRRIHLSKPIKIFIMVISLNFSSISIWFQTYLRFIFAKYLILPISWLAVSIFDNRNDLSVFGDSALSSHILKYPIRFSYGYNRCRPIVTTLMSLFLYTLPYHFKNLASTIGQIWCSNVLDSKLLG